MPVFHIPTSVFALVVALSGSAIAQSANVEDTCGSSDFEMSQLPEALRQADNQVKDFQEWVGGAFTRCGLVGEIDDLWVALEFAEASVAMAQLKNHRILAPLLKSSMDLGNTLVAEIAPVAIREAAYLPDGASDGFRQAFALEEEHHNIDALNAFKELLDDAPEDTDLQAAFLRNCYLAGDDCPPLWPEHRARIPEWSCTEAVNLAVEHFSDALGVAAERARANSDLPENAKQNQAMVQGFVGNGISFSFEMTDWIVPSSIHTEAMIAFMVGQIEQVLALGVVLNDPIMRCNRDRHMAVLLRHGFGAPGETYDDLMRPVMRDNLLDVAWRVLDYELPEE